MKHSSIILFSLSLLALAGCRKEDAYLDVPEEITLTSDRNDIKFDVSSNTSWEMTVSDPWFKISPKRGDGNRTVRLVAERNNTGMERNAVLQFVAGNIIKRVPVAQPSYEVTGEIEVPASVEVEKGKVLTIPVRINTDDWEYTITDGEWLGEATKTEQELSFSLNPAVAFDETVPAVIEFTTPSDEAFYRKYEILPKNYFRFAATADEIFDLGSEENYEIAIESNIDWDYELRNGAWLKESSRTSESLVFEGLPDQLLNPDIKAVLTFSSADYANFSYTLEIKPVPPVSEVRIEMVNKAGCKVLKLDNEYAFDGTEYLFDGYWLANYGDYKAYPNGDSSQPSPYGYKFFGSNVASGDTTGDSFTIDAGKDIRLARYITYLYYGYKQNDPVWWEIYRYDGNGAPDQSGSWNNWTKIGEVDVRNVWKEELGGYAENYSPKEANITAGTPFPRYANGESVTVEYEETRPARYYRFKMLVNGYGYYKAENAQWWSGRTKWLCISEVSLYEYIAE